MPDLRSDFGTAEKSMPCVGSQFNWQSTADKASRSIHGQISSPLRSGPRSLAFLAQIRVTELPNPKRYVFNIFSCFLFQIGASTGGAWAFPTAREGFVPAWLIVQHWLMLCSTRIGKFAPERRWILTVRPWFRTSMASAVLANRNEPNWPKHRVGGVLILDLSLSWIWSECFVNLGLSHVFSTSRIHIFFPARLNLYCWFMKYIF